MALPNGTVYKPTNPILTLSNGQPDSNKHPFIVVAQDDESIYGFHMTSHRNNDNPVEELLYQELKAGVDIQYNNPKITQNAYAKLDHIHKINYEDVYTYCTHYAFITPKTQEQLYTMVVKHLFITDRQLAVKDENTNKLATLTLGSETACRNTKLYSLCLKYLNVREYQEIFEEHINKIRERQRLLNQSKLLKAQLQTYENDFDHDQQEAQTHHRRAA